MEREEKMWDGGISKDSARKTRLATVPTVANIFAYNSVRVNGKCNETCLHADVLAELNGCYSNASRGRMDQDALIC